MKEIPPSPADLFRAARHFPDGALLLDPAGKILDANDAAAALLGRPRKALRGRSLKDFVADPPSRVRGALGRWARAREPVGVALRFRAPGRAFEGRAGLLGPPRRLGGRFILLRFGRPGESPGREISRPGEEVQRSGADREGRVGARTAELAEAVRELETFVYSVSHDLRAPLRSMASFGEILLEDFAPALGPEGREYARRIVESARRMDKLTHDLLAYSRLSRSEIVPESVDLEALAEEVLREMATDLEAAGARVTVEKPLPHVTGHGLTLRQAIVNLVGNAVKFVRPGVAPRVRIFAERAGGRVRLVVEDNGIGIAREHQSRLFRVFERLHANDRYAGTGIGLAMVKRAVERMGGRAGVESEEGKGSRFWVELPPAGGP